MTPKIDPEFEALIPPLSSDERAGLEESIKTHGCRVPLDVWDGVLVDGHNRFKICTEHGIAYETKPIEFADRLEAEMWIIRNQFDRRNLGTLTRIQLASVYESKLAAQAKQRRIATQGRPSASEKLVEKSPPVFSEPTKTRDEVAKLAGVSSFTYTKGKTVLEKAAPELRQAVNEGRVSVSAAAEIADLPAEKQREIANDENANAAKIAKEIKAQKHAAKKQERLEKIKDMPWPSGKYRVIYADPPWAYDNAGLHVSAAQQYETMDNAAICALPVGDLAHKDSVLFMWATSPLLPEALDVIKAWGFTYKTSVVWDKQKPNFGNYVSVQHEFLLIATRGACTPDISERPGSVMAIPRDGRHSEKPKEFRELVDRLYPHGPRIELFARDAADGWERWGNEAA